MQISDKPKISSLTKFVIFSISVLLIYIVVSLVYAWYGMDIPETLTTCVFGSFGGEILMCAIIKIFKLKEEKEEEENDISG